MDLILKLFVFLIAGCTLGKRHFSTSKRLYVDSDNDPEESDSSSSSVNTVFDKLKDKSTPEFDQYFDNKQTRLDATRDAHIDENRDITDSEADSDDEGLGGEYNYRDDNITDIHAERSKNLADRREIVGEMRENYIASRKEVDNDSLVLPIKPVNKRSRDEDDSDNDNSCSKKMKVTNDNDNDSSSISIPKDTNKQSNIDFVLEKQSLELPSIPDSDGGGGSD